MTTHHCSCSLSSSYPPCFGHLSGGGQTIEIEGLTYFYPGDESPALNRISLELGDGENTLLFGPSGCGKSTLLRSLNGLVPTFYGGRFDGEVRIDGQSAVSAGPAKLARRLGFLSQIPESQIVMDRVDDEITFGLENQGIEPEVIREGLDRVSRSLGIAHLLRRRTSTLSGGELQIVLLAAVLALEPKYLVLDEPTSQLDPGNARRLLSLLRESRCDGGSIIISDHRLQRVAPIVDRSIVMNSGEVVVDGGIDDVRKMIPAGLNPLPSLAPPDNEVVSVRGASFSYGERELLTDLDFAVRKGEVFGILGANGSGKSTLLRLIFGFLSPSQGTIKIDGLPLDASPAQRAGVIGYVCQNPDHYLFAESVELELEFTLRTQGVPTSRWPDRKRAVMELFDILPFAQRFPRSLSSGEKVRVSIATVSVGGPRILMLDETTRGMDIWRKNDLRRHLHNFCSSGGTVILATHDTEFLDGLATRVLSLPDGELREDGA